MKTSCVFFVLGFVIVMAFSSEAQPFSVNHDSCCFEFFEGKIPPAHVRQVQVIDSHCPQHGFIVRTTKHHKLCVRKNPWA
ncbi:C-C motif chemokine 5-like [Clarias gariepinus]|uniref:C-C motif chemokine 5-like n=1 Tax=Clarias gariepinus TaxID=13013 RepID=UPI00234C3208|nr:C-C motif chemokine 5-like [Clarias gariepinus]